MILVQNVYSKMIYNLCAEIKMQLMVTSVADNIKYLKNCGAKHHLEMSTEIMYYTQGLQFRHREDGYLQR